MYLSESEIFSIDSTILQQPSVTLYKYIKVHMSKFTNSVNLLFSFLLGENKTKGQNTTNK